MGEILRFEADRRAISITINSFQTEMPKDDRASLFPVIGLLYPEGLGKLSRADDVEQVRSACEAYGPYRQVFADAATNPDRSLEDAFFEYEVKLLKLAFEQQCHYGVFFAWLKLKEQEIRNLVWIAECLQQQRKDKINNYVTIF